MAVLQVVVVVVVVVTGEWLGRKGEVGRAGKIIRKAIYYD